MIVQANFQEFVHLIDTNYVGDDWVDQLVSLATKILAIGTDFMFRTLLQSREHKSLYPWDPILMQLAPRQVSAQASCFKTWRKVALRLFSPPKWGLIYVHDASFP